MEGRSRPVGQRVTCKRMGCWKRPKDGGTRVRFQISQNAHFYFEDPRACVEDGNRASFAFTETHGLIQRSTAFFFFNKNPLFFNNADGFYNGLHFHRVVGDYGVQGGCPFSVDPHAEMCGSGSPPPESEYDDLEASHHVHRRDKRGCIVDEHELPNCVQISNKRMTVAMSSFQSGTCGSQFFINLQDNTFHDFWDDTCPSKHPVFGKVVAGMDVVEILGKIDTDPNDRPVTPIKINAVTVVEAPNVWDKILASSSEAPLLIDEDRDDSFASRFARRGTEGYRH